MRLSVVMAGVSLGALSFALPSLAHAQQAAASAPTIAQMEQQILQLTHEVQVLKAQQTVTPKSVDETAGVKKLPDATIRRNEGILNLDGITLYGTVDVGVSYLNHGAPLSTDYGPGLPYVIQKYSHRSTTSLAENGMGQSRIGLTGLEPITKDISVLFKLETGFQPLSGTIANGPKSLVANNGVALNRQVTSGDSSRAGQAFEGAAYGGVASKTFGTVIFGRQNSLVLDNLAKYDPQALSQAFSPLGYSGLAGGGGLTESARFDSSLKYAYAYGPAHFAALHQFGSAGGIPGGADQVDLGLDKGGLSVDATYTHVSDAVSEGSLTAAQNIAAPGTLTATISDNTAFALQGKYAWKRLKLYAGYEYITFANPRSPVAVGTTGMGGYVLSVVNNTAYTNHRIQQVSWFGARYSLTPSLDIVGAYYRYDQNSYKGNGCANVSFSSCSGNLQDYSLVADYRLTKRFDVYAGVNASSVANGMASGYEETSAVATTTGARFSF